MNLFGFFSSKYAGHPEAVIITCFFNPMNSPYRLKAFHEFYRSIRHLNHRVVECVIGEDQPQLEGVENLEVIHTENLLWHKEAILNLMTGKLPAQFKYVFWVDADVIFTNKNWMPESVRQLQGFTRIIQPFEYCVHLNRDENRPGFDYEQAKPNAGDPARRHPQLWRSFAANYATVRRVSEDSNYDRHGHVGFAWGARREVLAACPLYDKALIGGADHIVAHAAAGQIPSPCIVKSFKDDLAAVTEWSQNFYAAVKGRLGYVKGDLFHLWHGDIEKRQYLKRIQDFTIQTKEITEKDANGLYVTKKGDPPYVRNYFRTREATAPELWPFSQQYQDDGFLTSMALGYLTDSTLAGGLMGGNFPGALTGELLREHQIRSEEYQQQHSAPPHLADPGSQPDSTPRTDHSPLFDPPPLFDDPGNSGTNEVAQVESRNFS